MQAMVAGPAYDRRPIFTDIGTEKSSWALRSIYDKSTSSDIRSALQEVREPDRPPSNQLTMLNDLTKEHAQAFIGILTGAASVGTGTGTGTGTESGVEVLLGEGYVADIKLTNVPISKLQELLDKKLAKAFYKKVEWSYKPYSSTPSKVMTIETQDLAKAEIVVVGTQDSPKFIIEKHSKQRYVSLGGNAAGLYLTGYYVSYDEWDAYASGGQVKTFPASFVHGSHSAVAGYWAGKKAAGDAESLAMGLEFTLNVIPFGSTALEVNDHGVTAKAGVMFVTDVAMTIIPVAKAGVVAGKISVKTAEAAVKTAKAAGYAAAGLQASMAIHDASSKGASCHFGWRGYSQFAWQ